MDCKTIKLNIKNQIHEIPEPAIMGILNIAPDSFSDGGLFTSSDRALKHVDQMVKHGAKIIDVGGESTRPGAIPVDADEEIERVIPIVEKIKAEFGVLVSIDTFKSEVAETAITEGGADMVNDISALQFSPDMAGTVACLEVPVILMHIKGTPRNMQDNPIYQDVVAEIKKYFSDRIQTALDSGIKRERIILDPGIGFGKTLVHNIEIIKHLKCFLSMGQPLLMGLSRKSFLGLITEEKVAGDRDAETLTANLISIMNGASIIRVHDVKGAVKSIKILNALT